MKRKILSLTLVTLMIVTLTSFALAVKANAVDSTVSEAESITDITSEELPEISVSEKDVVGTDNSEIVLLSDTEKTATPAEQFEFEDGVITKYIGTDTDVIIPDQIDGVAVTSIGVSAFENCTEIESVLIANTIQEISPFAFYECKSLESVRIPESVINIGWYAFANCYKLKSITIPENVVGIGYYAFEYCGLEKIEWNAKSASVEHEVFHGAGTLRGVEVVFGESVNYIPENLFGGGTYTISKHINSVLIGSNVTSIGGYAFRGCTGLTSITIPDSVTNIGNGAFSGCTGLTSVTIGESVSSIGYNVFEECPNLKTAGPISEGYDLEFGWETEIPAQAFRGCSSLTNITLPGAIKSVGSQAFEGCSNLKTAGPIGGGYDLEFGWEIEIPAQAFMYCHQLLSITIGNSVTSIGDYAFYECIGLTSVTIGESVTSIGDSAFNGCSGLTSVTIGNSVTSIGSSAFKGCINLVQIEWNAVDVSDFGSTSQVFSNAGTNSEGIEVVFENNVKKIPAYLFYDSYSKYVKPNITSVAIGNSVTSIGDYAFYGCTGLTSVIIPDSVASIGVSAFNGCSGLTSVTIGNSVTSIGGSAFSVCSALKKIYWNAKNVANFNNSKIVFENSGNKTGLEVIFGDNVERIPDYAFYKCTRLTEITIPDSVTSIGDYAFYGCEGLTSITIPESVASIGSAAFNGCTNLQEIYWNTANVDGFNDRNMIFSNAGTASEGIDVIYSIKVEDIPEWLFKSNNSSYIPPKIKSEIFLDTIKPEIISHSPDNGSEIFNSQLLETSVADNFNIATIKYEYKAINEDTWNILYEVNPDQKEYDVNYNWDLSDLETNTYELKITAIDKGGLESEEYIVQYHNTKYELPVQVNTITKKCNYDNISLSWEYEGVQKFFKQFNIYRKKSGDAEFSLIKTTTQTEYSDNVERGAYIYRIEVVDILGNTSISEEFEAATYENDTIAPVVALSFNELAGVGKNILFDASASTDDDAIRSYLWNFGNGDTSTEMVCNYSYATAGEYVTSLTVTDYAGNTAEIKKSVLVIATTIDSGYRMVEFDFTNIKENQKISNASLYIREDGDTEQNEVYFKTDAEGKLCIPLKVDTGYKILITDNILGVKECSAFINGYSPSEIDKGLVVMQSIPFAFNRSKNLKGTLTSHEMSLEEIVEAGIDLEDEDNYNVTEFKATFTYGTDKVNYTYYKNSSGKVYHSGGTDSGSSGSGASGSSGGGFTVKYAGSYKNSTYFIVISGETKWLKQMFDVSIVLFNESDFEWVENCTAELILPEGLSLVNKSENQSGTIGPMETAEGHWFVRGDKAGEYNISAIVKGVYYPQPAEPFTMTFESKEPIVVQESTECLELNLYDVPTIVKNGQTLQFDIEAKNISNITLNNFSIKLNNCEQFSISDEDGKVVYSNETMDQGLELEKLLPGEAARFTATILVNFPDASGEQVKYYLKNYFVDSPFKVNVHLKITDDICMEKKEYSVTEEDTVRIYATLDSVDNTGADAVWSVEDVNYAIVEDFGYSDRGGNSYTIWADIKGIEAGESSVIASIGDISERCKLVINKKHKTYAGNFAYRLDDDGDAIITEITTSDNSGTVSIPTEIDGHKVIAIDEYCIYNNPDINRIIIPPTIELIKEDAFKNDDASDDLKIYYLDTEEGWKEITEEKTVVSDGTEVVYVITDADNTELSDYNTPKPKTNEIDKVTYAVDNWEKVLNDWLDLINRRLAYIQEEATEEGSASIDSVCENNKKTYENMMNIGYWTEPAQDAVIQGMFDFMQQYGQVEKYINFEDADDSNINNLSMDIVKKIIQGLEKHNFEKDYGDYTVYIKLDNYWGAWRGTATVVNKKTGASSVTQIVSSTEDTKKVMSEYMLQLKELGEKSIDIAIKEYMNGLSSLTGIKMPLDEIKERLDGAAKVINEILEKKGLGNLNNFLGSVIDVIKCVDEFSKLKESGDTDGLIKTIADLDSKLDFLSGDSMTITQQAVNMAYKELKEKTKYLHEATEAYLKGKEIPEYESTGEKFVNWIKNLFKCPVDVYVYNENDELIGGVSDEQIFGDTDEIYVERNGDIKTVYVAEGSSVHFELVGTDVGTLDVVSEKYQDNKVVGRTNFYGIDLYEGKEISVETSENVAINGCAEISLESNGETITTSEYLKATDNATVLVVADIEGEGTVTGDGWYARGDSVTLLARPKQGHLFRGWYNGEIPVSFNVSYTFCAKDFVELTAKFDEYYVEPSIMYGDVYNDDVINMKDAQSLYMYIVGSKCDLTEYELMATDVYRDGVINVKDAQKLAQYLAGWSDVKLGE